MSDENAAREDVDVVVVGAGLAGLCAARELVRGGCSVRVLEARDRVGGRTQSEVIRGATFDLGGQWIGPGQRRMAALCQEFGIETFPTWHTGTKVLECMGRRSTFKGAIPSLSVPHLLEAQVGLMRLDRIVRKIPLQAPHALPESREWDDTTVESWRREQLIARATREVFDVAVRTVFGAEPSELSLLWFLYYLQTGGGLSAHVDIAKGAQQDRFVRGAQSVSLALARALEGRVMLSAPVRAIAQDDDGVWVEHARGVTSARYAVMAVPPSMLTRMEWAPALPGTVDQVLQRMPMGATVKVLAFYERAFWRERGLSGEVVATRGPISAVFDNSSADGRVPCLVSFVVGRDARGWSSRPAVERRQEVLAQLARCVGDEALRPVEMVEKDWSEEPWTRGCPVGNAVPGTWMQHAALRDPVGRVHLAGTETATAWTGYMEGAVESGERAAREVLECVAEDRHSALSLLPARG